MANAQPTPNQPEPKSDADRPDTRAIGLFFRIYKSIVSPVLHVVSPSRCIYLPTCSEYAYTAISRFGAIHGSWLALQRIVRCHPWGTGGLDPVPERAASSQNGADHLP
ncbi:MAG TPA: membrane protein insertion efficiency factor YidD [Acidobacteriaceae bacterium]